MKTLIGITCALFLVFPGTAQSKKFTDLPSIDDHFDAMLDAATLKVNTERLAAIEAFVKDPANKDSADLAKAKQGAAGLKLDIATKTAKAGAPIKAAHAAFLEGLENDGVQAGFTVTNDVVAALLNLDAIEEAKEAWGALGAKFGAHPGAGAQIKQLVERETMELAQIGQAPKAFTVKDMKDQELSVEKFKGKVVLIDFWATWCGPCKAELPNVIAAYKKYHAQGFEIIGISLDREDKTVLDKFLADHPDMTWPQFYDGKFWKNEVSQLYGVQSIPATYLLDREGKIYRVGIRGKALEKAVAKLLAKPAEAK